MMTGPFQRLPGSSEGWAAGEPWLLPITDAAAAPAAAETPEFTVRRAARPLWIAANGLCLALALLIAAETGTGWMGGHSVAPVAKVPVVTASAS